MHSHSFAASVGAVLLLAPLVAGATEPRGYTPQDAATAATLPIEIVAPARIEPQVADAGASIIFTSNGRLPGLGWGQTIGANVAGGLIASVIISAAIKSAARDAARDMRARMISEGCNLDAGQPIVVPLQSAIATAWPGANVRTMVSPASQVASAVLDSTAPRYVFRVSPGVSFDGSEVVTTIDADAYPAAAGTSKAVDVPAWHDTLILVSDAHIVPPKSQADINRLVSEENARYDALNLGPAIAMLNKDSEAGDPLLHKDEYRRVKKEIDAHNKALWIAKQRNWLIQEPGQMHLDHLVANHCEAFNQDVAQTTSLIGEAITALAQGRLPPRLEKGAKANLVETPGLRATQSLPGGAYLSRRGGDDAPLDFRYSYLAPDKDEGHSKP